MASKILFKFKSGTHGLNEELHVSRHSTKNNSKACLFASVSKTSGFYLLGGVGEKLLSQTQYLTPQKLLN